MIYGSQLNSFISQIDVDIAEIGRLFHTSVKYGNINIFHRENVETMAMARDILKSFNTLDTVPTFFYKVTFDAPTVNNSIEIFLDEIVNLENFIVNVNEDSLTSQQCAESFSRELQDVSHDYDIITINDIHHLLVDDSVYLWSYNSSFSSPSVTQTVNGVTQLLSPLSQKEITDFIDNVWNYKGAEIRAAIPNILTTAAEFKDRKDYALFNISPYIVKKNSLSRADMNKQALQDYLKYLHLQNTDSYLDKNGSYEVSAKEIVAHLANTGIHLSLSEIKTTIGLEVDDLIDTDTTGKLADWALLYVPGTGKWTAKPLPNAGVSELSNLQDIDFTGLANHYILRHRISDGKWEVVNNTILNLSDVPNSYESDKLLVANPSANAMIWSDMTLTEIRQTLADVLLLKPTPPENITAKSLILTSTKVNAYDKNLGIIRNNVTGDITPSFELSSMLSADAFLDPEVGDLYAVLNNTSVGQITLTNSDDSSTNQALTITQNIDYYDGVGGSEGFYTAILASIQLISALTPQNTAYSIKLSIDLSSDSNTLTFYVESSLNPSIGATAINVDNGDTDTAVSFLSGIKVLTNGAEIKVTATANNVIGNFYNETRVIRLSDNIIGTNDYKPVGASPGPNYNIVDEIVTISNNKFDESYEVPIEVFTALNNSVQGTVSPPAGGFMIIDSLSNPSIFLNPGSGQYPSTGYTSVYDHSISLLSNEALQLIGGKFRYPSANYNTLYPVNGPNYSSITGYRYVVFRLAGTISNASSISFNINGAENFNSIIETGVRLQVIVDNGGTTTTWIDANAAYSPTDPDPGSNVNGDKGLDFGASTATFKRITFGGTTRTGIVYVRIGLDTNSTKKFSNIS